MSIMLHGYFIVLYNHLVRIYLLNESDLHDRSHHNSRENITIVRLFKTACSYCHIETENLMA